MALVPCPLCSRKTSEAIFEASQLARAPERSCGPAKKALGAARIDATYLHCPSCQSTFTRLRSVRGSDYGSTTTGSSICVGIARTSTRSRRTSSPPARRPRAGSWRLAAAPGTSCRGCHQETGARRILGYDPTYRGEHGMQGARFAGAGRPAGDRGDLRPHRPPSLAGGHFSRTTRSDGVASGQLARLAPLHRDHGPRNLLAAKNPSLLFHEYYRTSRRGRPTSFMRQMGFRVERLWSLFGGSYMGIIACRAPRDHRPSRRVPGSGGDRAPAPQGPDLGDLGTLHLRCSATWAWGARSSPAGVDTTPRSRALPPRHGQRVLSPRRRSPSRPTSSSSPTRSTPPEIRSHFGSDVRFVSLGGRFI